MIKRKPDFICLGTQKAGTTTLHDILKNHSQIYLPNIKEASFFTKDEDYNKGVSWWLDNYFKNQKPGQKIGVFSPDYLYFEEVPGRIKEAYKGEQLKFIIILRDPIERAFSQYLMSVKRGLEDRPFEEAIELEEERLKSTKYVERANFSYIARGRYLEQIQRYLAFIDQKDILFLSFEDEIKVNIDQTIEKIEQFVGVPIEPLNTSIKSNVAVEIRSKKIHNLLRRELRVKKLARKLFSDNTRFKIRSFLRSLNETKISKKELEASVKKELYLNYFSDQTRDLEILTGLDLSSWGNYQ